MINFYEVNSPTGAVWSGAGSFAAIDAYRLAPLNSRLIVTLWESDDEDAHLIGQQIDITDIINAAIVSGAGL